jgi:hypothetical protein
VICCHDSALLLLVANSNNNVNEVEDNGVIGDADGVVLQSVSRCTSC